MSNNYWNQQPNSNNPSQDNPPPRSGSLLRDYRQQQRADIQQESPVQQYSPGSIPPQGPPSYLPVSPMPPTPTTSRQGQQPQQNEWPAPQSWPSSPQRQQGWVSNTVQMVRRWSGAHIPAVPPVDQNPLVLYRPAT